MKKKAKFDLCVNFFCELDDDGTSTWFIKSEKNFLSNYYNDENTNSDKMLEKLNIFAINLNLPKNCCKKPFQRLNKK